MAEASFGSAEHSVSAHWESPHPPNLGRYGGESEILVGKTAKVGHMLANRNVRRQQASVNRPRPDARVVDIIAVYPDDCGFICDQPVRSVGGQEGMIYPVSIGPPVAVPSGVNQ